MKKLLVFAVTLVSAASISVGIATASSSHGGDHVGRGAAVRDASCVAQVRARALGSLEAQEGLTFDQAVADIRAGALRYLRAQDGLTLDQAVAGNRTSALQYFRAQEALTLEQATSAASQEC